MILASFQVRYPRAYVESDHPLRASVDLAYVGTIDPSQRRAAQGDLFDLADYAVQSHSGGVYQLRYRPEFDADLAG